LAAFIIWIVQIIVSVNSAGAIKVFENCFFSLFIKGRLKRRIFTLIIKLPLPVTSLIVLRVNKKPSEYSQTQII